MAVLFRVHLCVLVLAVFGNGGVPVHARNSTSMLKTMSSAKDIRNFLTDTSLITRQINCVLGKGKCDRLGAQIKKAIPKVVNNNCARCTSAQAINAKKLINFVQHNYPAAYADVLAKYKTNKTGSTTTLNQRTKMSGKVLVSGSAKIKSNSAIKPATSRVQPKPAKNSTLLLTE